MASALPTKSKPITQNYLLKNTQIPFIMLATVNLLGFTHLLPVFIQLLFNSTLCVYLGCVLGSKITKKASG